MQAIQTEIDFNTDSFWLSEFDLYTNVIDSVLSSASAEISNILPSDWAEQNRVMGTSSAVPGKFSFRNAPYAREILDRMSPNDPCRRLGVIKGVQLGLSTSFIQNAIGYNISENPMNMMLLVGHDDLVKDSSERIDDMIDSSGLRQKLKSNAARARKTKSGDTDKRKEFEGGYLSIGIANHKSLRQVSIKCLIVDDFDSMKSDSKSSGSTIDLIDARQNAFDKTMKQCCVSTPELKESSNIEPYYLRGDQRHYFVPCQCCGEMITIEWSIPSQKVSGKMAGITWELDNENKLIPDSVGYTCQKCDGFFDDSNKTEMLLSGEWRPTAIPESPYFRSYKITSLYAPIYMRGWLGYVRQYLRANPPGGKRNEAAHQTFVNLCLAETYEYTGEPIEASKLQKNARKYEIGIIPEKQSLKDGNGRIVLVTCGSDMNGTEKDGRLDYEIIAYSESGATYSIDEGSIGTFIPKDKNPHKREHFTYHYGVSNSIWKYFEELLTKKIPKDTGGYLPIMATGLDAGYLSNFAYQFSDNTNAHNVYCLKGDPQKFIRETGDYATYRRSKDRGNLFLVESNHTKDILVADINLNWDSELHTVQPFGFMNFPYSNGKKYSYKHFFSHFEAETKVMGSDGRYVWRKTSGKQNHKWDCRLYANVSRDIVLDEFFKVAKVKNGNWGDYVSFFKKKSRGK